MSCDIEELSSILGVLDYSDANTSYTELMEKACHIIRDSLRARGITEPGMWTWSVFSANNYFIEQKASGGFYASIRVSVPKREAKEGMIARVLRPESRSFIYEPHTPDDMSHALFTRIIDNTRSAIVARVERANEIVGVINIESDKANDFDADDTPKILEYTSKIISSIMLVDHYRELLQKQNSMFHRAIYIAEKHATTSLRAYLKDILELFYLEYKFDSLALFLEDKSNQYTLVACHKLELFFPSLESGASITGEGSLLARSKDARPDWFISTHNITPTALLGKSAFPLLEQDPSEIPYASIFKIRPLPGYSYLLIAMSVIQRTIPKTEDLKRYEHNMRALFNTYLTLERERVAKQEEVLASELYNSAIDEEDHSTFLNAAAQKIAGTLRCDGCYILFLRQLQQRSDQGPQNAFELISTARSVFSDDIVEAERIVATLNAELKHNPSQLTFKLPFCEPGLRCDVVVDLVMESIRNLHESSDSSAIIALCVMNERHLSERTFEDQSGLNINTYLSYIVKELRLCVQLINRSIKNADIKGGFEVMHRWSLKFEEADSPAELIESIHKMYGSTYDTAVSETLSGVVRVLRGSYLSIFELHDTNLLMTKFSQTFGMLPPNPPAFERGKGLTGRVLTSEEGEGWEPRVEAANRADLACRSYWNTILKTQFRYFYGRRIEWGDNTFVITIIGPKTPYFQEQIFIDTTRSLVGALSDIIHVSGLRHQNQSTRRNNTCESVTQAIVAEVGPVERNAFLMIRYSEEDDKYVNLRKIIRQTLQQYGLKLLIADEKKYHPHLGCNLEAYMGACRLGIAVIDDDNLSANIAYELGYMLKSNASTLILKDQHVKNLRADFMQLVWDSFNINKPSSAIPFIDKWLKNEGFSQDIDIPSKIASEEVPKH